MDSQEFLQLCKSTRGGTRKAGSERYEQPAIRRRKRRVCKKPDLLSLPFLELEISCWLYTVFFENRL